MSWLDRFFGNANTLQGVPLSASPPATGQALVFDGAQWAPGTTSSGPTLAANAVATGTLPVTTSAGLIVPFDTNAGSIVLTIAAASADGHLLSLIDAGRATASGHTMTLQDANGYQIQDPDTLALAGTYVLSTVRNLAWRRVTCARTAVTFWATP